MSKSVAIVQSSYIPWKGYFDLINGVDQFILYDEVQFTRRDWRNRNRVKTPRGLQWLTIPVDMKGNYHAAVRDIRIADRGWASKHWATIRHNYARAAHFAHYGRELENAFMASTEPLLSHVNRRFIELICALLGIRTRLSWSWDYASEGDRNERLISLCKAAGADIYVSGPSAKAYLDEPAFAAAGISVQWMNYDGYPQYRQLFGAFEHGVTVLDLLFNEGPDAKSFMKSFARPAHG